MIHGHKQEDIVTPEMQKNLGHWSLLVSHHESATRIPANSVVNG
jgi:hypothetical protein